MKGLLFLSLLVLSGFDSGKARPFIDPTGTYMLKGVVKKNRVIGHSGEIRARLLNEHSIAICLYVNTGYPNYKSGSMIDTLHYEDDVAFYRPAGDTSCDVYFKFGVQKVDILQVMTDPRSGCGFALGVFVPAAYSKVSSEVPVIQSLEGRGN